MKKQIGVREKEVDGLTEDYSFFLEDRKRLLSLLSLKWKLTVSRTREYSSAYYPLKISV